MNFLQLCQRLHLYLGGGTGGETAGSMPSTVLSQRGELLKIVTHVAQAWEDIQREYPDWLWMQSEGTIDTVVGQADYSLVPTDTVSVTSLTSAGTTATANVAAHPFIEGQTVTIAGATPSGYNGAQVIFNVQPTSFQYTLVAALTSPATGTITAAATRAHDTLLPWFAKWNEAPYVLCYTLATGATDEQPIYFSEPADYLGYYDRGSYVSQGRPVRYTVQPGNVLSVHPLPDKVYRIRYRYRRQASSLTKDSATPDMPSQYHIAIVARAMQYMGIGDDSRSKTSLAIAQYMKSWEDLVRNQRPRITWSY